MDVVDAHKKTVKNLRIWESAGGGCENVLEGRAVYLDDETALMCCTGAATLPRGATADPCMLVMRDGADVRKATQAFFALSQLNYSSPSKRTDTPTRFVKPMSCSSSDWRRTCAASANHQPREADMSQEWLNIQSFFTDHELIGAINDLSIAVKLELASVRDPERIQRAEKARQVLRGFLTRLSEIEAEGERELLLGIDAALPEPHGSAGICAAGQLRFTSVLMCEGAVGALPLLDADEKPAKQKLLASLAELRRVVEQHQQADASVIFEEQ